MTIDERTARSSNDDMEEGVTSEVETVDCTPAPTANYVLIGAGSSSGSVIPYICREMKGQVRGCVFIDHYDEDIQKLTRELQELKVPVSTVRLGSKLPADRADFLKHVEDLGMDPHVVGWDQPLHDRPALIRNHTWLVRGRISGYVQTYVDSLSDAAEGADLEDQTIYLVYVFGITGMTSATVALEAAEHVKSSVMKKDYIEAIESIGVGLYPPSPDEGAMTITFVTG